MFAASKTASVSGGYQIQRSLRFNSADSAYLNRTPASASNRTTWTWSGWVKRSSFGTDQQLFSAGGSGAFQFLYQTSTDCLYIYDSVSSTTAVITTQVFRDPSAWYHVVLATDTTQATASNRFKLYINGVQVTSFGTATYPAQNSTLSVNNTANHSVGSWSGAGGGNFFSGYMTEVNFIDGQALTPSSFGETNAQTGVWQPKAYSGTYGTNGFYLNFSDNSNTTAATLGKDYSGNGNNWTPNNFSVTAGSGNDSLVDSPTSYGTDTGVGGEVRGNYATLNALSKGSQITLSNGNLDYSHSGTTGDCRTLSSVAINSGKWYCEHTCTTTSSLFIVGIALASDSPSAGYMGATSGSYGYYASNGAKYNNGNSSAYGASWGTSGDVIGIAFDADAGTLTFYKNGTSQGTAYTSIPAGQYVFGQGDYTGSTYTGTFNFGQRPFAYTAPSGYKALCTQNLPTPTIGATTATQAGKYFNAVTYTGNGTTQAVTGVGFQPDFTWIKDRNAGYDHQLFDINRGVLKTLQTDNTGAEVTYANSLTSWAADGFNLGGANGTNINGYNFVAWNWKANGSGSTNTAGSITSTVSANTTSGFSIVKWTGTNTTGTIGHGLGVAPALVIQKATGTAATWTIYHASLGATKYLDFSTAAAYTSSLAWNNTAPTSTVVTVDQYANYGTGSQIAYCFAEVAGYSKFGFYTGNGSADGPFVYTSFRPAYVMIKSSTVGGSAWVVFDNKRNTFNVVDKYLLPNASDAEASFTGIVLDFTSNGFKIRGSQSTVNNNSDTYIFAAFAENPFKYSLAR